MNNKSYEQFLIIQATIEANKKDSDEKQMKTNEKQMKTDEKLTLITQTINNLTAFMMDQTNISKFSPTHKPGPATG